MSYYKLLDGEPPAARMLPEEQHSPRRRRRLSRQHSRQFKVRTLAQFSSSTSDLGLLEQRIRRLSGSTIKALDLLPHLKKLSIAMRPESRNNVLKEQNMKRALSAYCSTMNRQTDQAIHKGCRYLHSRGEDLNHQQKLRIRGTKSEHGHPEPSTFSRALLNLPLKPPYYDINIS